MTDNTNPEPTPSSSPPAQPAPADPSAAPVYSAPPVYSGPPVYSAPPGYPAPPVYSAPPGYPSAPPVSGMPVSAYPATFYPGYPVLPPKVPTRKGPWLWILAGVCTLLAAGIGALGYLIVADNTASRQTIDARDAEIENLEKDIRDKENVVDVAQDDRDFYDQRIAEEQGVLEDLQADCPGAVQAYIDAAIAGDDTLFRDAVDHMIDVCHI